MKKLHTLLLIAAFVLFGALLAIFDNSSPPVLAFSVKSSVAARVSDKKVFAQNPVNIVQSDSFKADIRKIPISNGQRLLNRRTEIQNSLAIFDLTKCDKPPENKTRNFTFNSTAFCGFGAENQARAKI